MRYDEKTLHSAWWALRIGLGVGPLLAGLDKFFNLLANWEMYLSPTAERMLPVSGTTFMHVVGVIEMIVGLAVLTRWTRLGAYVAMVWLIAIAVNLLMTGAFFDLAVRDLRSEEHTSELQSLRHLVCRLLLEKKKNREYSQKHTAESAQLQPASESEGKRRRPGSARNGGGRQQATAQLNVSIAEGSEALSTAQ